MSGHLDESAFLKFSKGTYSFPYTWWIGVIQISMLAGSWGARHQSAAQIRQQALSQILYQWWADPKRNERTAYVIRFIKKYFKSYLMGRVTGGVFTAYAQTGGAKWPLKVALPQSATNFTVASFGGGVLAVGMGSRKIEDILFATITGKDESVVAGPPIFAAVEPIAAQSESCSDWCSRTSGEYFTDVFMAPSSQELEPPGKPGWFRFLVWDKRGGAVESRSPRSTTQC